MTISKLLLEDGTDLLLEDGNNLLLEDSSGGESWLVSPSSGHILGAGQVLTATGTGTSWSGSPFSITGGTGTATITAQSTSSATAGSITLNITVLGTIIISDGVATATYNGSAIAPGTPTIGTVTNNHTGTVSVAFTPNADNGGATVTAANATGSLGDNGSSAGSSPISVSIASGHLGSAQTWTVTQTNSAGTSSASGSAGTTPTSPPGTPTIGSATAGNASASIAFTSGITGGLTVTYTAVSTPGGFTGSGSSSPINVTGLTNGTAYTFKVHATNSDGTSADSLASNSVTPQNTVSITIRAPYLITDTVPTPTVQIYTFVSGTLTALGSPLTTGFAAIPNITNGCWFTCNVTANGAYGDFYGIAVFTGINGSLIAAVALYSPPTTVPASLVQAIVSDFLSGDTIVMPGYQLYNPVTAATIGSRVTAGIAAIPGGTNQYAAQFTFTPNAQNGAIAGYLWDGG